MIKTSFFSIILILSLEFTYSQIPIGLKYDLNGIPLNGYFDPLTYAPENKISIVHNSDSYEVGYYYDSQGVKIEGLIKFENEKIYFKKKDNDYKIKITPDEIKYFVIGVDSFFVVTNFYYKNKIKDSPEFAQYITEFNGFTFAKHYHFTSGAAQQYAMQSPIIETYLVKAKDSLIWDNFPDNSGFKEIALKYFSNIQYLKDKISSGEYKSENMLSIIKMAEYYYKFENGEPILFDKFWQEIIDKKNAIYKAKILNILDSIWTIEYYIDSTKLYQANYSSFYPNTKNGNFISYYPEGKIRQLAFYENNKPQEVKLYGKTGSLDLHYKYIENKVEETSKVDIDLKYIIVTDSFGNNILNPDKKISINVYDDFSRYLYVSTYDKNELSTLYRLSGSDTIFQIVNPDYDFKINSLQKKFDYYLSDKKYDKALSVNAQGIIMVSVLIDNKGYVLESSVLNKIHPEIDKLVDDFIKNNLLQGEYRYKFKPYKKDKIDRYCEVVIPFEFSINRFYRQPVNYNNLNYMNWQMQNQMHQQMMQQQMNSYRPPSMPRTF